MSVRGGPYEKTHALTNALATLAESIFRRGTTLVSFVKRSVITRINRLPRVVFVSGPSMSIHRSRSGSVAGNKRNGFVRLRSFTRFFAHPTQFRTVAWMSAAIAGQ